MCALQQNRVQSTLLHSFANLGFILSTSYLLPSISSVWPCVTNYHLPMNSLIFSTKTERIKRSYVTLFVIVIKSYDLSSDQLSSENYGPVLLLKSVFRHCNCFLLSVATDGKDKHELNWTEKSGPTFQIVILCLQKSWKKLLWWWNLFDIFFVNLLEHFV